MPHHRVQRPTVAETTVATIVPIDEQAPHEKATHIPVQ